MELLRSVLVGAAGKQNCSIDLCDECQGGREGQGRDNVFPLCNEYQGGRENY